VLHNLLRENDFKEVLPCLAGDLCYHASPSLSCIPEVHDSVGSYQQSINLWEAPEGIWPFLVAQLCCG
ncbi:hypothetical protein CICLE_v10007092mg, partial [Citrus x clementina]